MQSGLVDPFGRRIEYVRLSVTDRCDLRCFYCLPEGFKDFEIPEHWLSFTEIERIINAFAVLGTQRVRITGGEPLVRKGLAELVSRLAAIEGINDLSLSSNAVRLAKYAQTLYDAGVSRLNISLDSLQANRFKAITKGRLDKVLSGLMAAKAAGFQPIKINMVVMKGINDDEVEDMVEFCIEHDFTLRFIETMPMGETGRQALNRYVDLSSVRQQLAKRFDLVDGVMPGGGPARYVRVVGSNLHIGFITPISQHFCATCNRVRIAADGTLYPCLGQEHAVSLGPMLRDGISQQELMQVLIAAIANKPERHEFRERPEQVLRFMSMTGG